MSRIRHALIMAAGRGSRMMPLTDVIPKPMAPYKGSTLIAEGIDSISKRIPTIHITIGYKKAMLAKHVIEKGAATVLNTEGKPNCWWIYNTLIKHLDEPIYVLTCDNVVELDFDLLEECYQGDGEPACMLIPVRSVEGLDGDYIFHDECVVTKLSRAERSDIYCSGIQILNPARINKLTNESKDFYGVWNQLITQRELMVSKNYPKAWFTVDTLDNLKELNC